MTVKVEAAGVNAALRKLSKGVSDQKASLRLAAKATDMIKVRTLEGKDYRGRRFKPYSKAYLAQRKAKGLGSTPDLFASGDMMRVMQWKRHGRSSAVITFVRNNKGQADYAYAHNHGVGVPKREFFRLSTKERKMLTRMLEHGISR